MPATSVLANHSAASVLRQGEVLEETAERVGEIREADLRGVLPPLPLLGAMERAGPSWVPDSLHPAAGQHDKPLRLQLKPGHPLPTLRSGVMRLAEAAVRAELRPATDVLAQSGARGERT